MGTPAERADTRVPLEFFDPTEFVLFLGLFAVLLTPVALVLVVLVRRVTGQDSTDGDGTATTGEPGVDRERELEDA